MLTFIFRVSADFGSVEIALINNHLTQLGWTGHLATELGSIKASAGLWRSCGSISGNTICSDLPSSCSLVIGESAGICHKMMAARAFVTIACIISGISAICLFACALQIINQNQRVIMISKALAIGSFVMGVIGLAIGIAVTTYTGILPIKASLSVAAILAIVAVVTNLLGTVLAMMIR
jgi:hypothetical protein